MASRKKPDTENFRTLPERVVARITASLARHAPGLWAEEATTNGPACVCGLRTADQCYRHPKENPHDVPADW